MGIIELLALAVGLSMDAFAVSVCKGLSCKKASFSGMAKCGVWFGGFQALMPLAGYFLGVSFADFGVYRLSESTRRRRKNEIKNLKQVIEGRKDSKATYAYERCIEEMYKNMPYSLYKYGNIKLTHIAMQSAKNILFLPYFSFFVICNNINSR